MAKEYREGDTLTIKVKVVRVSDDGDKVTIECWGQRLTGSAAGVDKIAIKHEKGGNWPER